MDGRRKIWDLIKEGNANSVHIPLNSDRRKYILGMNDKVRALSDITAERPLTKGEESMLLNMSKKLEGLSPIEHNFLRRVWLTRNYDAAAKRVQDGVKALPGIRYITNSDQFRPYMSEAYTYDMSGNGSPSYAKR